MWKEERRVPPHVRMGPVAPSYRTFLSEYIPENRREPIEAIVLVREAPIRLSLKGNQLLHVKMNNLHLR